jgi:hypothetical protein
MRISSNASFVKFARLAIEAAKAALSTVDSRNVTHYG